jgi:threonine dehydrogenase-like Zn-dependent dehydrogenase
MLLPSLVDSCSGCFAAGDCRYCPEGNPAVRSNEIIWKNGKDGFRGYLKVTYKSGKIFYPGGK